MERIIHPARLVHGELRFAGDKSISHRALMFSALAEGTGELRGLSRSEDCVSTRRALESLGVKMSGSGETLRVHGVGLRGLKGPASELYLGNSGTTMRLLLGILAAQDFTSVLTGDESLSARPMRRVTGPLRQMGARIDGADDANFAPLTVNGSSLKAITYESPIASAQVKSALLLAGLYAEGTTTVSEPFLSRDHTERMLAMFGVPVKRDGLRVSVGPPARLTARSITVAGDISSAAFFMALAAILPGSEVRIADVTVNPTRTGFVDILRLMGADITIEPGTDSTAFEPIGTVVVRGSGGLRAAAVKGEDVVRAIDELPLVMALGCFAAGETVIEGAGELRVKETDRIHSMVSNLRAMGAEIRESGDNVAITGRSRLRGCRLKSFSDHRTAMALTVAALAAEGDSCLDDVSCVGISFPDFYDYIERIIGQRHV